MLVDQLMFLSAYLNVAFEYWQKRRKLKRQLRRITYNLSLFEAGRAEIERELISSLQTRDICLSTLKRERQLVGSESQFAWDALLYEERVASYRFQLAQADEIIAKAQDVKKLFEQQLAELEQPVVTAWIN